MREEGRKGGEGAGEKQSWEGEADLGARGWRQEGTQRGARRGAGVFSGRPIPGPCPHPVSSPQVVLAAHLLAAEGLTIAGFSLSPVSNLSSQVVSLLFSRVSRASEHIKWRQQYKINPPVPIIRFASSGPPPTRDYLESNHKSIILSVNISVGIPKE